MKNLSTIVLLGSLFCISCNNQSINEVQQSESVYTSHFVDSLDKDMNAHLQKGQLPGFTVSIFSKDAILYQKGFGYADLEHNKLIDEHTIQCIASISKTLVGACLMKAIEAGKLTLEMPINNILPYPVVHPKFPNQNITIKHLATHTSGISDDGHYDQAYIFNQALEEEYFAEAWHEFIEVYNNNTPMNMETYLKKVFAPGEAWNTPDNFTDYAPGTNYDYSNIAVGLLAHCIEIVIGKDFKTYSKEILINPLKMTRSHWDWKESDTLNHIVYYNEDKNPVPPYHTITYPDGGLFTSTHDLTLFLQEMMKGYYGESNLLSDSSFQIMMTDQIPTLDTPTGIIWDMDNTCCIGHGGNDFGIATMMFFSPKTGLGKILFTNISIEKEALEDTFYAIFENLFKYDKEMVALMKKTN